MQSSFGGGEELTSDSTILLFLHDNEIVGNTITLLTIIIITFICTLNIGILISTSIININSK